LIEKILFSLIGKKLYPGAYMSGKDPIPQAQAYEGVRATNPPDLIVSKGPTARDPTINDKKYRIGTLWVNVLTNAYWGLTSVVNNQALWQELATGITTTLLTSQQMLPNNTYISANAALSTFTLPLISNVGDILTVVGQGAGFWRIAQNALQSIKFNAATTTTGVGGSITSTQAGNTITLVCTVANLTWVVQSSSGAQAAYTIA
jgi:hypothetical protein